MGQVTISLGVVVQHSGDTPISIMQRVDSAVYKAKQDGRNTVHCEDGAAEAPAIKLVEGGAKGG